SRAHVSLVPSYPRLRARLCLRTMVKKVPACYGIRKGRGAPVVVHSWAEVVAKTNGFPGADFRKFKTPEEATDYANLVDEGGGLNPAPAGWS
ncbi:unnamed protein product, partial [Ectocarpus sp. 12 AP-2014]